MNILITIKDPSERDKTVTYLKEKDPRAIFTVLPNKPDKFLIHTQKISLDTLLETENVYKAF